MTPRKENRRSPGPYPQKKPGGPRPCIARTGQGAGRCFWGSPRTQATLLHAFAGLQWCKLCCHRCGRSGVGILCGAPAACHHAPCSRPTHAGVHAAHTFVRYPCRVAQYPAPVSSPCSAAPALGAAPHTRMGCTTACRRRGSARPAGPATGRSVGAPGGSTKRQYKLRCTGGRAAVHVPEVSGTLPVAGPSVAEKRGASPAR